MQIFRYIWLVFILVGYIGNYPRELQHEAPIVFMLGGVALTLAYLAFTKWIILKSDK
mgnify:CR=1 FL=1